jgi:hypothetical protein
MPTYVELLEHLQEFCQIIFGKSYDLPTPKNKCQVKNQLYLQEFSIFDLVKLKKMTHKLISLHRVSFSSFTSIIQLQQLVEKKVITVQEAKQVSCPFSRGTLTGDTDQQQQARRRPTAACQGDRPCQLLIQRWRAAIPKNDKRAYLCAWEENIHFLFLPS